MITVVTGGAGFIGSHLVDALVEGGETVVVVDSLAAGSRGNLARYGKDAIRLVERDLLGDGWQEAFAGAGRVYHLAADPDVRQSALTPESQLNNN
ncbi:MAG: NAD-dependent epimerase/dehydratase family protein, partial [Methanoregulaceae archaeon]|nr:NAD-dependent epimerase/dehydratase family protein [Methanoregulaceae archaeon]